MKTIEFNKDYSKLNDKFFTTIRKNDKHIFDNEIVCIKTPTKEFKAICDCFSKIKFKNIPSCLLCKDLDFLPVYTRESPFVHEQALEIIKKIPNYENLTLESFVHLYSFVKV